MTGSLTPVYHDFSGLAELKRQAREDQAGAGGRVAKQFESLFVQMMVKQMRQAGFGGGILDSDRTRFYREMYDQQLSLQLTREGGLGLSGLLRRQLGAEAETPRLTTGGLEPYWRNPVAGVAAATATARPAAASPVTAAAEEPATSVLSSQSATAARTDPSPATDDPASPHDFVRRLWSSAEAAAAELGVPVEALLAQAALETGWGSHMIAAGDGRNSHNLFGIKADGRWQGGQVGRETLEFESGVAVRRRERFRTYESFEQSFQDYVALLKGSPRYAEALANTADPESYFRALQDAGYATDPAYADKILRVMQGPEMRSALAGFKAAT